MKNGDWVRINFVGRVKATGDVFDASSEADAKKYGIFDEKKKYGPSLVILGAGNMMPGVEKELLGMKVGEKRTFDVSAKEGAGQRRPELIRVISSSKFMEKGINPFPGMWVNIDNRNCKVMAVSGGRVRVDFNHPLAGKELTYEAEIKEDITDRKERVKALLDYYGLSGKVDSEGKKNVITLDKDNPFMRKIIDETLKKWGAMDAVEFKSKAEPKGGAENAEAPKKTEKRAEKKSADN